MNVMSFTTFIAFLANSITVIAVFVFLICWMLRNLPEDYKQDICRRAMESRAEFDAGCEKDKLTVMWLACNGGSLII